MLRGLTPTPIDSLLRFLQRAVGINKRTTTPVLSSYWVYKVMRGEGRMMSMHERDMTEIRMSVSKLERDHLMAYIDDLRALERDHLMAYIDDLRAQRCEASLMEADYLAEVIHMLTQRLVKLEGNIAQHTQKLEVDR